MSKDILIKLGDYLRKEAEKKYKTNVDFASACDVDEKTIRRIFRGEQNISIKVLERICDSLKIKLSDVFIKIGL